MTDPIKQRISLEGADDTQKQLDSVGKAGEEAFKKIGDAAKEADAKLSGGLPGLASLEATAKRAGVSVDEIKRRIADFSQALPAAQQQLSNLSQAGQQAGGFFSQLAELFGQTAVAATGAATGVELTSARLGTLAKGGAVVAAIGAVVTAIGGIAVQGAQANDAIDKIKGRLEGLAGTKLGGELADGLQKMAKDAGALPAQLEPAVEALTKLQQKLAGEDVGGGFAKTAPGVLQKILPQDAEKTVDTVKQLFEILRNGGASTEQASKAVADFFDSAAKKSGITGDMLRKISDLSPEAGRKLAEIGGSTENLEKFASQFDKIPASLESFQKKLGQTKDRTDADFQEMLKHPKTFSEALEKVKRDFGTIFEALSGGPGRSTIGDSLVQGIGDMSEKIKTKLLGIIDQAKQVGSTLGTLFDSLKNNPTVGAALDAIKSGLQSFSDGIGQAATGIKNILGQLWSGIEQGASSAWQAIKSGADAAWEGIKTGASALGSVLAPVWNALSQGAQLTWNDLKTGASAAWEAIKSGASTLAQGISGALSGIGNSAVWQSISAAAQSAWQTITAGASQVASSISAALSAIGIGSIWQQISASAQAAWDAISQGASSLAGTISGALSAIGSGEVFQQIASAAQTTWDAITQGASTAASGIVSAFSGIGDGITSVFSGIAETINSILGAVQSIISQVQNAASSLSNLQSNFDPGTVAGSGFAGGGWTGPGGTFEPAGVVHRGEYVQPAHVVRQPGVLAFMEILRQAGGDLRRALANIGLMPRGFSFGGLVDGMSRCFAFNLPQVSYAVGGLVGDGGASRGVGLHPVTINFPGQQPVRGLFAPADIVKELEKRALHEQVRGGGRMPSRGSLRG